MKALPATLVLFAALLRPASAQVVVPPEFNARNTSGSLIVQVITATHQTLDLQTLVRVRSLDNAGSDKWNTTHMRGEAYFTDLNAGSYEVEVSAAGYRTAAVRTDILGSVVQTVQVVLKADENAETDMPPAGGVSRKAREESERGIVALRSGKPVEAEKRLRNALKEAPQHPQINYLLGVALLQRKQRSEAEQYFQQAIVLDPKHAQALVALAALRIEQKDYDGAARLLDRAIVVKPRAWRPHWLLANTRLSQENYDAALSEAQLAVDLSKGAVPETSILLGEALASLGRVGEAADVLRKFLHDTPASPDAPAVKRMIATLEGGADVPAAATSAVTLSALPTRASSLLALAPPAWKPAGIDDVLPPVARDVACPAARVLAGAGSRVTELVQDLDRYSADQTEVHERLDYLGKPLVRESRKRYYMAAIAQSSRDALALHEYERDLSGLGRFSDSISTHGLLTLGLIFHPALQENFEMHCEGLGEWNGEPTWLVYFRQRADRPRRVQTFVTAGHPHPVAFKGRAWIGAATFQISHIEAELMDPMRDIALVTEHEIADYGPVEFKTKNTQLWLPVSAEIYLQYRGNRYRVTHHFDRFTLFSVDSQQQTKAPQPQ